MTHGTGGFNNPGKDYQILWDQSTNTNVGSLADQELLAYGGAYDTYMVDDFSTGGQTWNIAGARAPEAARTAASTMSWASIAKRVRKR